MKTDKTPLPKGYKKKWATKIISGCGFCNQKYFSYTTLAGESVCPYCNKEQVSTGINLLTL
jgi:hypothetical protein